MKYVAWSAERAVSFSATNCKLITYISVIQDTNPESLDSSKLDRLHARLDAVALIHDSQQ